MAKKSLTDLLREEVKKSPKLEGETEQETTDAEDRDQDTKTVEKSLMNTPSRPSAKRSTHTKAELEATITELRAALEEAQHKDATLAELKEALEEAYRKEGALQQQITDLQSDLQHQKKSVHKLEKELEKLDQLKTDLQEAKKAAHQLAQANEKLTQQVNTLQKENEDLKPKERNTLALPGRPIQKSTDKPTNSNTPSWLD